jgi:hypothetical protein
MSQFVVPGVILLTALLFAPGAGAQSRDDLATAARAFDESALRYSDDNAKARSVRKWTEPIRLAFDNPGAAPNLVELTRQAVKTIAAEADISIVDLAAKDATGTMVVYFDENGLYGRSGDCIAQNWLRNDWAIRRGELRINPTRMRGIDRCVTHESMHAFGFNSHPHAALSVLSYVYKAQRTLTDLDRNLIHTLYDPRMSLGLKPASQLACRILGERLGSSADDVTTVCTDRKGPVPSYYPSAFRITSGESVMTQCTPMPTRARATSPSLIV